MKALRSLVPCKAFCLFKLWCHIFEYFLRIFTLRFYSFIQNPGFLIPYLFFLTTTTEDALTLTFQHHSHEKIKRNNQHCHP
jgi:hypothetical protein